MSKQDGKLKGPPQQQKTINTNQSEKNVNLSQRSKNKQVRNSQSSNNLQLSKLEQIQEQKQTIIHELKRLNQAIDTAKQQYRPKSILQRREEISNNKEARKQAINFINHQKAKKKELEERKKQHEEKTKIMLKKQTQQSYRRRERLEAEIRQEKRRAISIRINECKAKRQEFKSIHRQSNILINKLIKQDGYVRQQIESPKKNQDHTIKIIQRRPHIDLVDIEKHEKQYLQRKEELSKKKQRSISVSYPIKKFGKNKWAEKLQQEQQKAREEERLRQLDKKMRIQKRLKYGYLISSLLMKHDRPRTQNNEGHLTTENSKSIQVMPISKLAKRTVEKTDKSEQANKKRITTKKLINSHYTSIKREEKDQSPEERQRQQQKQERERRLRKQTSERLKKMESINLQKTSSEPQSKYQSNFKNYLGQVKLKKKGDTQNWSHIMNDGDLSREQKYSVLLKNAIALENKAKFKQSLRQDGNEVVDLYLDSIQAKLAILQSI